MDHGKDGYEIEIPYEEAEAAIDLKILFEARHSEDLTKNVLIGASFWNNKKNTGVHLLSPERDKEDGWGVCTLLHWIQHRTGDNSARIRRNDGTDGDCIIIFLQESVYFI